MFNFNRCLIGRDNEMLSLANKILDDKHLKLPLQFNLQVLEGDSEG